MTNTTSVDSDDAVIERLRMLPDDDKRCALMDVLLDTCTWQPAVESDVDGRTR